jgi:hypothetical protein
MWARAGLLSVKHLSGAMMPPWLYRFLQDLEDDGVQSEADVMFIPDEVINCMFKLLSTRRRRV